MKRRTAVARVAGAAQHEARSAQWCAADPGPRFLSAAQKQPGSRISGAPLRFASRCTASGTRVEITLRSY